MGVKHFRVKLFERIDRQQVIIGFYFRLSRRKHLELTNATMQTTAKHRIKASCSKSVRRRVRARALLTW